MTGTPFNDDVAGAGAMLRERFDAAVGTLTPDIGRLVADGTAAGRGAVRRRRALGGVAGAAAAVIAVGAVSYATQNDLLGLKDQGPTDNSQIVSLVPATARGLAAAIMAHTESLGTPVAVGGTEGVDPVVSDRPLLNAQVAYQLESGVGVEVDVYASSDRSVVGSASCEAIDQSSLTVCRELTLSDGASALYLEYGDASDQADGQQAASAMVLAQRDDQAIGVIETVSGQTTLPVDDQALLDLASDPAVGISTTTALNAAGEDIADFKKYSFLTREKSSGSGSATAPPPTTSTAQQR
jgi:hypothetical protein